MPTRLQAPPPQPAITGPSRRSVELLAGSALTKTVTTSSANPSLHLAGTPKISSSGTGALTAAPPAAAAAPAATAAAPALPAPAASAPPTAQTADRSADDTPAPPASDSAPAQAAQAPAAAQPAAAAAAAPAVAATGGAAILARLRQQRTETPKSLNTTTPAPASASQPSAADAAPAPAASNAKPPVVVLYASQTGTCQEIARNLAAEALEKGYNATCASMNEHGFPSLSPTRSPYLIVVASSTGDGDPPDNAAAFYLALRKKGSADAEKPLTGVRFTLLGLGDSNYTRFMYVPRGIKTRLAELGADEFYPCAEADEVDGVENTVEPWSEGLWDALAKVMVAGGKGGEVKEAAAPVVQVAEVPPAATAAAAVATAVAAAAAAVVVAEQKADKEEQEREEKEKEEEKQEQAVEPEELPAPAAKPPAAEQAQPQEGGQQEEQQKQQEAAQQEEKEQAAEPQPEQEAAPADGSLLPDAPQPTQEAAADDLPTTAESGVDDSGSSQQPPATPQPPASPPAAADGGAAGSAEGSPLSPPLPEYDDRDLLTPRSEMVGDLGLGPDSPRSDSVASGASGAMGAGAKNFRKSVELRRTAHDLANR